MHLKIWPLGIGGWMPAHGRQTNALLIEYKERLIIVDAGTGISNLLGFEVILDRYKHVDLILTHYHLDHLVGLFYLPKFLSEKSVTIWGPGAPAYDTTCEKVIKKHLEQPYGTTGYETIAKSVECKDYNETGFDIGEIHVAIQPQKHTLPSFGLTFDDQLHIATDTCVDDKTFKKNVRLLLHECWAKDDESAQEHASMDSILELMKRHQKTSNIEAVGLIHLNPRYSDTEYASWIKSPIFITQEKQLIELK